MRSLAFEVVDELSHDVARYEQRVASGVNAIVRYSTTSCRATPGKLATGKALRIIALPGFGHFKYSRYWIFEML